MAEEGKDVLKKIEGGHKPISEGHQPIEKGYQPTQGNLDVTKPPQGGSGVPAKPDNSSKNSESD